MPLGKRSSSTQKLIIGSIVFFATCIIGTLGYMSAGWDAVDAIYMVTITIFGVGYGEVHPVDAPLLKLFTIFVIVAGCSSGIYVIGGLIQMVAEGEVNRMLGVRGRTREIAKLRNHTIICGFGRVGRMLAERLQSSDTSFLILDCDPSRVHAASEAGFLAIEGDATDDHVLTSVGIKYATVLATVLPHDAINVFITLSARDLNAKIEIVARAECPTTERKLRRSGANHVVLPASIAAMQVALLVRNTSCSEIHCDAHEAELLDELQSLSAMATTTQGQSEVMS